MGMKKSTAVLLLFAACIALGLYMAYALTEKQKEKKETLMTYETEELKLAAATDLHYLSDSLHDDGEMFTSVVEHADGKLTEYTPEILNALKNSVLEEKPDALILSGDLTFNGEMASLKEIKEVLKEIDEAGIPVLVIPGNHDIRSSDAYSYEGKNVNKVEGITQASFLKEMREFGYDKAESKDEGSFSYLYAVSDHLSILFLDANTKESPGAIREETLLWAESCLKKAEEAGTHVMVVSHQNVLPPSSLLYEGFVIECGGSKSPAAEI